MIWKAVIFIIVMLVAFRSLLEIRFIHNTYIYCLIFALIGFISKLILKEKALTAAIILTIMSIAILGLPGYFFSPPGTRLTMLDILIIAAFMGTSLIGFVIGNVITSKSKTAPPTGEGGDNYLEPKMKKWWRIAIAAGLVPLASGSIIFMAWYLTRASWLMMAGVITIYAGLGLIVVGAVSLVLYVIKSRRAHRKWGLRATVAAAILLINFPAAAGFVTASMSIMCRYTVVVDNVSSQPIDRLTLLDPTGARYEFGPVPADSCRKSHFDLDGEGSVKYDIAIDGDEKSGILFGYITSGPGHSASLSVSDNQVVTVKESF